MAVLEILTYPDERLKQESRPVEKFDVELRAFLVDLEETMRAGPGGVGIAAPQVGRFERIVLVDCSVTRKPDQSRDHRVGWDEGRSRGLHVCAGLYR